MTLDVSEVRPLSRTVSNGEAAFVIKADEADASGASHVYSIEHRTENTGQHVMAVHFQKGPIAEVGLNGIQNEHLLKIVIDRLQGFQRGPHSCRENALALTKLEEAIRWLNHRTFDRTARGVEGTNQK